MREDDLVQNIGQANLASALNEESTKVEASEAIRALIEEIRLVPVDGALKIELYEELAALFALAAGLTDILYQVE